GGSHARSLSTTSTGPSSDDCEQLLAGVVTSLGRVRVARVVGYTFAFVPVRVVDVERPHALQHRMHPMTNLDPSLDELRLQLLVLTATDPKRQVVQRPHLLIFVRGEVRVRVRVRYEHDQ